MPAFKPFQPSPKDNVLLPSVVGTIMTWRFPWSWNWDRRFPQEPPVVFPIPSTAVGALGPLAASDPGVLRGCPMPPGFLTPRGLRPCRRRSYQRQGADPR